MVLDFLFVSAFLVESGKDLSGVIRCGNLDELVLVKTFDTCRAVGMWELLT